MSFYTVIKTELKDRKYIILALEEMKRRGEITSFKHLVKKDIIQVDRAGDTITIKQDSKTGNFQLEGDSRILEAFTKRFKQFYAYQTIKENLPLDFEIDVERESAGNITLLLKG